MGLAPHVSAQSGVYSVRERGAVGDGKALDTAAINQAVELCASSGGGQVRFPPGRYLSGTIRMKSHVHLWLDAGATLVGSPDPEKYSHFTPPREAPESKFKTRWHRALILGDSPFATPQITPS